MKIFVASDIHGSSTYCKKLMDRYAEESADRILLLGDLLYHGPRNNLPDQYETKSVMAMLNEKKEDIMAVRGNCDAEVDQMVLDFPIMADYCSLYVGKRMIYATHGHLYGESNPPKLHDGDILLCGHTHVPKCVSHPIPDADNGASFIYMNPGSVSLPKENSWHGYMIIDETGCVWKDVDGKEQMRYDF